MKSNFLLIFFSLIFAINNASCKDDKIDPKEEPTNPGASSKMDWWDDARFGLFIHWGLYSVWEGKYQGIGTDGSYVDFDALQSQGNAEWIKINAKIPTDTYLSRANEFNSRKFDPNQIAQLAKDAGMKYVIITAKHHEGFCLWDSKHDPINISLTQADADVLKKLRKACSDRGLKFGVYFSQNQDWSIYKYLDLKTYESDKERYNEYVDKYVIPVIDELLTELDLDILWWDSPRQNPYPDIAERINQHLESKANKRLITNDRLSQWHKGDFGTGEAAFYEHEGYAENSIQINQTWGYSRTYEDKQYYASDHTIITSYIVGSVCRGQNIVINIGPRGDGSIPDKQVEVLNTIGKWMSKNSKAIHKTTRALSKSNPTWGRITKSKSKNELYLIVISKDQHIYLDGIETQNLSSIKTVDGRDVKYKIEGDDRVSISDFRPTTEIDDLPIVLVANYKSSIQTLDYTYIDGILSPLAFWGDEPTQRCIKLNSQKDPIVVAWWGGYMYTRIKFNGETGNYKVKLVLDELQYKTSPSFLLEMDNLSANVTLNNTEVGLFDTALYLRKGQIYDVKLTKTNGNQSWANFKNIEFIKQ